LEEIQFPDHYSFKPKDLEHIEKAFNKLAAKNKIILTTEKDSVRFMDMSIESNILKENMAYIPLQIKFLNQTNTIFDQQITEFVESYN